MSCGLAMIAAAMVVVGCDEDRATPVVQAPAQPQPGSEPPPPRGPKEKNPISGHRTSTYGKAYDVAEDLVDNKIPAYNKRLEEEMEKNKR